jgi:hypothetical protein
MVSAEGRSWPDLRHTTFSVAEIVQGGSIVLFLRRDESTQEGILPSMYGLRSYPGVTIAVRQLRSRALLSASAVSDRPAGVLEVPLVSKRTRSEEEMSVYTLIRSLPLRVLLQEQAPALGVSLVLAESFYKFHSFSLECVAFLGTWFVLDAAVQFVRGPGRASNHSRGESGRQRVI